MKNTNRQVISVSSLNRNAKRLLESEFQKLYVEGEVSNLAKPNSGHWYFTLKDDEAQVKCAMFRNRNEMVRIAPRNGQKVVVFGRISLYEGRGEFQMIVDSLEDSGEGELRRAYENLKMSLQAEGLFKETKKQKIPEIPRHIAIITSPSGAAIQDVLSVMERRFPSITISILPVQVQGDDSGPQIVAALQRANRFSPQEGIDPFDLILLTRGGGSIEDLWSFNTEPVARAIATSLLPVVSAVGHESDFTIADLVADLRAPTPSVAAELVTPNSEILQDNVKRRARRLQQLVKQRINNVGKEILNFKKRLRHPQSRLEELAQRLDDQERRLIKNAKTLLDRKKSELNQYKTPSPMITIKNRAEKFGYLKGKLLARSQLETKTRASQLANLASRLDTLTPLATLQRGYAIVSMEESGDVVTDSRDLKAGDRLRARLKSGVIITEVKKTEVASENYE